MEYKIFGCKTNKYFAEKWANHPSLVNAEGVFVSSCVVTDQAKAKWVKFVKKALSGLKEGEKLFLTGCGSIRDGKIDENFYAQYAELAPYASKIVLLGEDPEDEKASGKLSDISGLKEKLNTIKSKWLSDAIYTRKHLVIQTGCDNFCTFCLTVQARGRHKSRDISSILAEIDAYVATGGKEVVLTGTNIGAWGAESSNDYASSKFVELIDAILEKTTIERLRVSSLGVEFLSDKLLERFKKKRIHAYVHLSVQSGSDRILRAMNRHYYREFLLERLEKLRDLEREDGIKIQIGADLIVGFPGESKEDFNETLDLVENRGITQLHAFPFSAHVEKYHVPAGSFPNQVDEREKLDRLNDLLKAGEIAKKRFLKDNSGSRFELLLEGQPTKDRFSGWSENYIALDETNFVPDEGGIFKRGNVVGGAYKG